MRKNLYLLILILSLGLGVKLVACGVFDRWRPQISYILKHTPLCMAENAGLIKVRRAHYSEDLKNTIDILRCTPSKAPQLIGGPFNHEFIVVSDLGGVVQRFDTTGNLVWQVRLSMPRGLDIQGERVLVGEGKKLRVISLKTGENLHSFKFENSILAFREMNSNLFILLDGNGHDIIRQYDFSQYEPRLIRTSRVNSSYARGIDVNSKSIFIADTFSHRIIELDVNTLELKDQIPSYYPNSVQLYSNKIIVAEEHLNVISEFNTNPLRLIRTRLGCQNNTNLVTRPSGENSATCISLNTSELYSPNDAVDLEGRLYIADTDNHRVIEFFDGRVIAELTGFNNPINIRVIR